MRAVETHPFGFIDLRHLRIVHHDLDHAKTQRSHLPPDDLQPGRLALPLSRLLR